MEYKEFVSLVEQMREKQAKYFKLRNYDVLVETKRLEKLVDEAIADFFASENKTVQLELGL